MEARTSSKHLQGGTKLQERAVQVSTLLGSCHLRARANPPEAFAGSALSTHTHCLFSIFAQVSLQRDPPSPRLRRASRAVENQLSAFSSWLAADFPQTPSRANPDQAHTAVVAEDQRQTEPGMLGTKLSGHASESPLCRCDEIVFLAASVVAALHDTFTIALSC